MPVPLSYLPHAAFADMAREIAHARDVAVVIERHILLAERLGLDGVHLTEISAFKYIQRINDFFKSVGEKAGTSLVRFEGSGLEAGAAAVSWADDIPAVDHDAVMALGPPEEMDVASPTRTTSVLSTSILHPDFSSGQRTGPHADQLTTNQTRTNWANWAN